MLFVWVYRRRLRKKVRIEFLEFHRPEKKFQNVEALKNYVEKDIHYGENYFQR